MREIRPSGSEGGVALTTPLLPLSAALIEALQGVYGDIIIMGTSCRECLCLLGLLALHVPIISEVFQELQQAVRGFEAVRLDFG